MTATFKKSERDEIEVYGLPGLPDGTRGRDIGEQMAAFWGKGRSFYIVNKETGKLREFVSEDGYLKVKWRETTHYSKDESTGNPDEILHWSVSYHFGIYDKFKNGLCALSWTLEPDGFYYMDSDGFGAEDTREEIEYCIINKELDIIVPFQKMKNVRAVLEQTAQDSGGR